MHLNAELRLATAEAHYTPGSAILMCSLQRFISVQQTFIRHRGLAPSKFRLNSRITLIENILSLHGAAPDKRLLTGSMLFAIAGRPPFRNPQPKN